MSDAERVAEGDRFTHSRTFTTADVEAFTELSGDENSVHREPDDQGRLVVHGLLTGTLPTKIGGDLDYVARELHYTFHRPVYTGQEISCEMTVTDVTARDDRLLVEAEYTCSNDDEVVLTGDTSGVIFR